jgi:hypothetical protein
VLGPEAAAGAAAIERPLTDRGEVVVYERHRVAGEGTIRQSINARAERLLGYGRAELVGRSVDQV